MKRAFPWLVLWLFVLLGLVKSNADIISGSNVILGSGDPFSDYGVRVYQDIPATDFTAMLFDHAGESLVYQGVTLDEGSEWYFASYGDPFFAEPIALNLFDPFTGTHNVGFGDFYMAFNTGFGFDEGNPDRSIYGWVLFRNSESGVEMLDNAVAYEEDGIVVGTLTAIPEPGVLALLVAGLSSLILRRKS